jgi:4-diphosphocytidyl-2-C-methyl-D-erythritol kinase
LVDLTITLPAFAKINLSLRVLGRRADGYHELDTVLQTISLHDTFTFESAEDDQISLECDDRSLPIDETNLVFRAAMALQARYSTSKGVKIRLEKRIPMQAGLGGGSSDAAVTLMALARLWNLDASQIELSNIAATLGADVPFFMFGGTARGRGIGADVTPLADAPKKFLAIVKPDVNIQTAAAYSALNVPSLTTLSGPTMLSGSLTGQDCDHVTADAEVNDFDPVLSCLEPEIARAKLALLKAGAQQALLAGSGSAVFGIFDNREAQERAIQVIELESGWRVFPCSTVGRSHYRSAMGPCSAIFERFTRP